MKKTVVILLLLIYGSATMGATVHLHYCMKEFVGWSLFNDKDEKCDKCGMEEEDKGGCCKDDHKQFKLKVDHQKAKGTQFENLVVITALPVTGFDFNFYSSFNIAERYPACHAPPDIGLAKLHILHSVFLI